MESFARFLIFFERSSLLATYYLLKPILMKAQRHAYARSNKKQSRIACKLHRV